jgi:hypothetical protein
MWPHLPKIAQSPHSSRRRQVALVSAASAKASRAGRCFRRENIHAAILLRPGNIDLKPARRRSLSTTERAIFSRPVDTGAQRLATAVLCGGLAPTFTGLPGGLVSPRARPPFSLLGLSLWISIFCGRRPASCPNRHRPA